MKDIMCCLTRCLILHPCLRSALPTSLSKSPSSGFHSAAALCRGMPASMSRHRVTRLSHICLEKMLNKSIERDKIRRPETSMADPSKVEYDTPWSSHRVREFEPRRVRVVEHLLMNHITELLATEEFSRDFDDLSVEITTVQIAKGFGQVNVLWVPITNAPNHVAYDRLRTLSARLRNELNSMQILGKVPRIEFVQDRTAMRLRALGENFSQIEHDQPPADSLEFTEGEIMEITVEAHPIKGVQTTVAGTEINPLDFGQLPEIRHDLGGIDRDAMLNQLIGTPNRPFKKPARA